MKNMSVSILLYALFLLFGFAQTAQAMTWVVTKAIDSLDRVCDSDCSLREAIEASQNGDTINFSPLFDTPQTIVLVFGQLVITKSIQINGPTNRVLIRPHPNLNTNKRIIRVEVPGLGYVGLFNLKLYYGIADSYGSSSLNSGGAVYAPSGDLYVVNCEISKWTELLYKYFVPKVNLVMRPQIAQDFLDGFPQTFKRKIILRFEPFIFHSSPPDFDDVQVRRIGR